MVNKYVIKCSLTIDVHNYEQLFLLSGLLKKMTKDLLYILIHYLSFDGDILSKKLNLLWITPCLWT
jgi:hypothetical protein